MPRGEEFKCEEIAEIWRLRANQKTIKEIAAELGRSYGGIYKVLQRGKKYHADKRSGRCRSTNERDNRRIVRMAEGGVCSDYSTDIWAEYIKKYCPLKTN